MAKITRTVTLNGVKHWIRANTEQEYADKLLKLVGSQDTAFQAARSFKNSKLPQKVINSKQNHPNQKI